MRACCTRYPLGRICARSPFLQAVLFPAVIASCGGSAAANAAEAAEASAIVGQWHGVYYGFPKLIEFDMSVQAAGGGPAGQILTGTLDYAPSQVVRQSTSAPASGQYAFGGLYDPELKHFQLKAYQWLKPPPPGYRLSPPPAFGIYDPGSDTLAGIFDAQANRDNERDSFFVCVRSSKAEELQEFVRLITGVTAEEAELEERQQLQEAARQRLEEEAARRQVFISYRPQIQAANAQVSRHESYIKSIKRSIERREHDIARLDDEIAQGGSNVSRKQKNRERKVQQVAKLKENLAAASPALDAAVKDRDALLDRIEQEHPELKEQLAKMRPRPEETETHAGEESSSPPATPEERRRRMIEQRTGREQQEQEPQDDEAERLLETVLAWASRLKTEYPDRELKRDAFAPEDAPNLFLDDTFRKHFGTTYNEMSEDTLRAIRRVLGSQFSTRTELDPYRDLAPLFTRGASNYDLQIYVRVQPLLASWLDAGQARLDQLTAGQDVFETIAIIEAAMEPFLRVRWPRERAKSLEAVAAARTRLADPVLAMKTDALIAGASGYAGAVALSRWSKQWPQVYGSASREAREKLGERVRIRTNEIVDPLLEAEIDKLDGFGRGRAALEAEAEWYRDFTGRYDFVSYRPRYQEGTALLRKQRERVLSGAQGELIKAVAACKDAASVKQLSDSLLELPGDRSTPAGEAILAAADQRLRQLEVEQLFSAYEISLMQDGVVRPPAEVREPTADEIGLAHLRELVSLREGRVLDHNAARITSPLGKMLNFHMRVSVGGIEKLDWRSSNRETVRLPEEVRELADRLSESQAAKLTAIRSGKNSFWCIYTITFGYDVDETSGQMGAEFANSAAGRFAVGMLNTLGTSVLVDEFELTPSGWRSPSAKRKVQERESVMAAAAANHWGSPCTSCSGLGWVPGPGGGSKCETCGGTGRQ